MREQRIACGQFHATPGGVDANLRVMEQQIGEAARKGCSIIVFPEMALTGYLPPEDLPALAEPLDGPSVSRLAVVCSEHAIGAVLGFPEHDPKRGVRHNSFVFLTADGSIAGVYRKIHLWGTEKTWAEPGSELPVFSENDTRYSGWICFDTRFPELGRLALLQDVEVCFVPTAWLGPAAEWELSLRARALDNTCYVVGSDLINTLPGLECRGHSMIVGPFGNVLVRAQTMTECVIDAVLDPRDIGRQRDRLNLRNALRPDLYAPLAGDR